MRFTVLEVPSVCPATEQHIMDYGLQDHIDTLGLDMVNNTWPSGHDATFFSNIFHDWDRSCCLQLARSSFQALPSGGRIYIHEMLLDDTKDGPCTAASLSMAMQFFNQGGKEFTAGEIDVCCGDVGLSR